MIKVPRGLTWFDDKRKRGQDFSFILEYHALEHRVGQIMETFLFYFFSLLILFIFVFVSTLHSNVLSRVKWLPSNLRPIQLKIRTIKPPGKREKKHEIYKVLIICDLLGICPTEGKM